MSETYFFHVLNTGDFKNDIIEKLKIFTPPLSYCLPTVISTMLQFSFEGTILEDFTTKVAPLSYPKLSNVPKHNRNAV